MAYFKTTESGFTLMEVLVAVAILGLGYMAIMQNFSVSMRNIERLEGQQSRLFNDTLQMEAYLTPPRARGEEGEEVEGDEYLVGKRFRLLQVTNEGGDLATLIMERL